MGKKMCGSDERNVVSEDRYICTQHKNAGRLPHKSCQKKRQKGSKVVGELEIVLAF